MIKKQPKDRIVLVGVIKNRRDLSILLKENWYRIPVKHLPKRKFDYLAFYQPTSFGPDGKRIQYYARVLNYQIVKRTDLLPDDFNHPRAKEYYLKIWVGKIKKLVQPIKNILPRRILFGFTTLERLLKSKDIFQLYNITPAEQIVGEGLKKAEIEAIPQHYVKGKKKRCFLDFAIFCKKGKIAIECDNKKAHSFPGQKRKDKIKNAFLKRYGWKVIRLLEDDIVSDFSSCIKRIKKAIRKLGGLT